MASPTAQVQSASVSFADEFTLQPLIGGVTVATSYYTGELMGRRSDGYVTRCDDSAVYKFLGILDGPVIQITSNDADGAQLARIRKPRYIEMPIDTSTVTRAGDLGKPVYAATVANGGSGKVSLSPGVNGNLVGYIEDVVASDPKTIGSATRVLIRPADNSSNKSALPLSITAAATLTSGYANRPLVVNAAAGIALVVPAPTGTGDSYEFIIGTTITSLTTTITSSGANIFGGLVQNNDTTSASLSGVAIAANAGGFTTITLDGTTKGGRKGDRITIKDVASGIYIVTNSELNASGTEATPFS